MTEGGGRSSGLHRGSISYIPSKQQHSARASAVHSLVQVLMQRRSHLLLPVLCGSVLTALGSITLTAFKPVQTLSSKYKPQPRHGRGCRAELLQSWAAERGSLSLEHSPALLSWHRTPPVPGQSETAHHRYQHPHLVSSKLLGH